jgi:hypothetical protein
MDWNDDRESIDLVAFESKGDRILVRCDLT